MKLWDGRFQKGTSKLLDVFGNSITFDYKLHKYDIQGSIAHSKMLGKIGVLKEDEVGTIVKALKEILEDIDSGASEFKIEYEDIHMNVEVLLINKIGELGKKLHTARSRNDQVALDLRLYMREEITTINGLTKSLLETLIDLSEEYKGVILPGYTHLQRAQPIRLGFYFMAYFEMFKRDLERLEDTYKRVNILPLGSGALAGLNYESDREFLKDELGFDSISLNAMDAVSDRDFAIEFLSAASILMMHLSRFCEELILWSSSEFKFITMDDAFSTGSSIMPQKKNPDVAELIRGKTGRTYGNLVSLLTIMKSLPLAYNKDMQEDKIPVFDSCDTVKISLEIFIEMIKTMKINEKEMYNATKAGFLNATDVADYLVQKNVEFRNAHAIVGKIVFYCIEEKKTIEELSFEELKIFSDIFEEDVYNRIDITNTVEAKCSKGSTSMASVEAMISQGDAYLKLKASL